jgi:hypothetical protein
MNPSGVEEYGRSLEDKQREAMFILVDEMTMHIESLQRQIEVERNSRLAMEETLSWRVTRPLRAVRRLSIKRSSPA